MNEVDHEKVFGRLFSSLDPSTMRLGARESDTVEFKENFNWASKDKYAKTLMAFANKHGGYILFGISNSPRRLTGLATANFENMDEAGIAAYLNGLCAPELRFEKLSIERAKKSVGVLYVHKSGNKPVVATKNDGDVRESDIYFRYNARSERVKYPELRDLIGDVLERERQAWRDVFQRVAKVGPENTAVLDVIQGTIEGQKNSLLIDSKLLPKLKFIKEGRFVEGGKPTLKLIGDVTPIAVAGVRRGSDAVRLTDDPGAPSVREESVLKRYPLDYAAVRTQLIGRYSDFKQNAAFHKTLKGLKADVKYCRTRYLDPSNPRSGRKDFFSQEIIEQFDKHYTKK